jgi:hypothetical protein
MAAGACGRSMVADDLNNLLMKEITAILLQTSTQERYYSSKLITGE